MPEPVVCGVYMLFQQHRLVYVGKSRDCYKRIADHRSNGRAFDYAAVTTAPEADIGWIESAMIAAMEPVQNRSGKARAERVAITSQPEAVAPVVVNHVQPQPPHPMEALSRVAAVGIARTFMMTTEFQRAWDAGELPKFPLDARKSGRGSIWLITRGDLMKWLEAKQAARQGYGGKAA